MVSNYQLTEDLVIESLHAEMMSTKIALDNARDVNLTTGSILQEQVA